MCSVPGWRPLHGAGSGNGQCLESRKAFLQKVEKMNLKAADELPDLRCQKITIQRDFIETEDEIFMVLISAGNEIWRELAVHGGYQRFRKVSAILKEKYGSRLADLVPTHSSW